MEAGTEIEKCMDKGRVEGEKNKAQEMAKVSLKEGLHIDLISKLTGLTKEELVFLSFYRGYMELPLLRVFVFN